ncbi:hypothetical protein [Aliiroseovarius subalbicans]|uniref:hypothetical protein n=1 Tax=Aliiroseovarius subalbicans TaxID=2925840 RepID=UPI001F58DBAE|nr:hypothetical protein [Aliiroseovarius subalbicans]
MSLPLYRRLFWAALLKQNLAHLHGESQQKRVIGVIAPGFGALMGETLPFEMLRTT